MATKKPVAADSVPALPPIDPQRMRVALLMVSDLIGGGQIPRPGTSISAWTKQINVQISWSAQLNNSQRPVQLGYGWAHVYASDIAGCNVIEDLIGLVYSKLQPPGTGHVFSDYIEEYVATFAKGAKQ